MKVIRCLVLLAALSGILCSCSQKRSSSDKFLGGRIDLDIIDTLSYKFVPLETNDESLLGIICQIMIDEDNIFIVSRLESHEHSILIFDRSGNFVKKINKQGRGPGEYYSGIEIDLDRENRLLLVYDQAGKKILRFHYDGTLHSALKLPDYMGYNFAFLDNNKYAFNLGLQNDSDYYIVILDSMGRVVEKHNSIKPVFSGMIERIYFSFFSKHTDGTFYYIPVWSDKMYRISKEGVTQVFDFGLADKMIKTQDDRSKFYSCHGNLYSWLYDYFVNEQQQYMATLTYNCRSYKIIGNISNGNMVTGSLYIGGWEDYRAYGAAISKTTISQYQDYFVSYIDGFQFQSLAPPEYADRPFTDNPILVFFKIKI